MSSISSKTSTPEMIVQLKEHLSEGDTLLEVRMVNILTEELLDYFNSLLVEGQFIP